ncbi:hypothetical protein TNCT_140001 [Trichonephila clavata]|uniref:Uncharacterized protein n=1 Tax=Trichonephila clavata TaxID=2740835 RepID=A0A8X6HMD2_TRICU|nr:hypothetical protein TNCT_140001 [Trichonephila clavata]
MDFQNIALMIHELNFPEILMTALKCVGIDLESIQRNSIDFQPSLDYSPPLTKRRFLSESSIPEDLYHIVRYSRRSFIKNFGLQKQIGILLFHNN